MVRKRLRWKTCNIFEILVVPFHVSAALLPKSQLICTDVAWYGRVYGLTVQSEIISV